MTMQNDDLFGGILDESPELTFFSFQDQFGESPNQRRFFQNQFQNIHNQFLGLLGAQIRQGQLPTTRFSDFLGDFDFDRTFNAMPPSFRGFFPSNVAPRTRFLPF